MYFTKEIIAFSSTFILAVIIAPFFIPILTRFKFGQIIRDDGPSTHFVKTGTPTMGGIIFLISILIVSVIYSIQNPKILPVLIVTLGFGIIGFLDDYLKIKKKSKDGLFPAQKMLGLIVVSVLFVGYLVYSEIDTSIIIPFTASEIYFDLGWLFIPFSILVLLATSNSVNLTDGLDGLASGVTLIVMVFFAIIGILFDYSESTVFFTTAICGGCLGFLVYNMYPAKLFMGDTGSLALGGAVGAVSILMKMPLILIIVGGVYVAESISVLLQVGYYKLKTKRIFKMAPLHHHFEMDGWKETKVVYVFWSITVLLCIIGYLSLRINLFK